MSKRPFSSIKRTSPPKETRPFSGTKKRNIMSVEDEINELYEDFKKFLKNYPKDTKIDVGVFRERFFNNEFGDDAKIYVFKFLIVVLKLIPEIRKNRLQKIKQLIMNNEEDNLTGIFKLADFTTRETYFPIENRKYFDLIKEYLKKIKNLYNEVDTSSFNNYGKYESIIPREKRFFAHFISNTQVLFLIDNILKTKSSLKSSSRSSSK
jgi:hypothetical protein